ncbi:MAG: AAA family ATPase [Deltaproteobacteria bacterium]|nr:AAA family ATPase [Deltaproteobacteria bacterium]
MQKIATLVIEGFRALRHLKIEGLGRINLITGRNNTGKSSVLEALRILAADASPFVLRDILRYREEDLGDTEDPHRPIDAEGLFLMSSLFHGFPQVSDSLDPIVIESIGGQRPMRLTMQTGWFSEEREADGTRRIVPQQKGVSVEDTPLPLLVAEGGRGRRIFPLDFSRHDSFRVRPVRSDFIDEPRPACIFVSPYGVERTGTLGTLWDKIALSDCETDVVDALRIIDPAIVAVSMVGGEGPNRRRTAIVRATGLPRPVPLRSFGDGLNRLFGIALSLVNAKDGLLLIDEFENGMHYTVQVDVWRAIFRLARQLNIQVFATSHSWDSVKAFQMAAAEAPDDGVLVRLSRHGEEIIPTLFREDELEIVTRDHIEVR